MKFETKGIINAPASSVWAIFGERFGNVADWSESIVKSSVDGEIGVGAVRTCELKQLGPVGGFIVERLTKFDHLGRHLAFDVIEGRPGMIKYFNSDWRFEDAGRNQTRAISTITLKMAWWALPMAPMIKGQFRKILKGFMKEMEVAGNNEPASRQTHQLRAAE